MSAGAIGRTIGSPAPSGPDENLEEANMTTATVHRHLPSLPALNMFVAVAAVVISVFALATAPAEVSRVVTQSPTADVSEGPEDIPSDLVPAPRTEWSRTMTPLLEGCEQNTVQRC
jgi:hypothetical protein